MGNGKKWVFMRWNWCKDGYYGSECYV